MTLAQTGFTGIWPAGSGIPAQLFEALISTSDDAIVVKSLDGLISTWNQGAVRLYGYTPDEVIGQPMTMLCPPDRTGDLALIEFGTTPAADVSVCCYVRDKECIR